MGRRSLSLLPILLTLCLSPPAYGEVDPLFAKIGIQPIREQRNAPDFCLEGLDGTVVCAKAFKGKTLFLNFWATWCGPCKEEMPSIDALYQKYREKDFLFLTIAVDYAGRKRVKEFIEKHGYHFPVLVDTEGKTLELFEISRIPITLMIDRTGKMVGRVIGPRNWNSPEVISFVDRMLQGRTKKVASLRD